MVTKENCHWDDPAIETEETPQARETWLGNNGWVAELFGFWGTFGELLGDLGLVSDII